MILVLLGTQNNSFKRLLEKIEDLIKENKIKQDVIVQAGYTKYESNNMEIFDVVSKEDLEKYIEQADMVITHGGVGSILMALAKNKKIIAVPRLHEYEEHVNNHQKDIVELFDKKGYIIGIQDVSQLQQAIEKLKEFEPKKYQQNNHKMLKIIEDFIDNC